MSKALKLLTHGSTDPSKETKVKVQKEHKKEAAGHTLEMTDGIPHVYSGRSRRSLRPRATKATTATFSGGLMGGEKQEGSLPKIKTMTVPQMIEKQSSLAKKFVKKWNKTIGKPKKGRRSLLEIVPPKKNK